MKTREERIAFTMNYCQHYNTDARDPKTGFRDIVCNKGHDINALRDAARALPAARAIDPSRVCLHPCIGGHEMADVHAICPDWLRKTREEGERRADSIERWMENMRKVGPAVAAWRTWSKSNRVAKAEAIDCPACGTGKLHLSQAAYNGHVHGRCTTEGCVSWME